MTNFEKYRDEILNYKNNDGRFCLDFVEPKILHPKGRKCSTTGCAHCHMVSAIWFREEYKEPEEPEVDWSKIPVDTQIYVKNSDKKKWLPRYFAKYENGQVYAWSGGGTSWTTDNVLSWKYTKLAEVE